MHSIKWCTNKKKDIQNGMDLNKRGLIYRVKLYNEDTEGEYSYLSEIEEAAILNGFTTDIIEAKFHIQVLDYVIDNYDFVLNNCDYYSIKAKHKSFVLYPDKEHLHIEGLIKTFRTDMLLTILEGW